MDRRILANVIAFGALSVALVVYSAVTLFGNPLREPRTVVADLPEAGGLRPGFSASHDGVVVGTVSAVELHGDGVRVTVELDPRETVPEGVQARVVRASAIGEQRLDFVSTGPGGDPLPDGARVPLAPDPIPPDVADVLASTERLLDALPADDLDVVVHELAVGIDGRADDLKGINRSLLRIGDDVIEVEPELRALLEDGPPVLDDFTEMSPTVHNALANTKELTELLAARDDDLVQLLADGGALAEVGDRVLAQNRASLECLLDNLVTVAGALQGDTLADLDRAFQINSLFFGAIDEVAVRGEAVDVGYGPAQDDALWLRTRLLLPPESPPASRYAPPRAPRPVIDGEACPAGSPRDDDGPAPEAGADDRLAAPSSGTRRGDERADAPFGFPQGAVDDSPGQDPDGGSNGLVGPLLVGLVVLAGLAFLSRNANRRSS